MPKYEAVVRAIDRNAEALNSQAVSLNSVPEATHLQRLLTIATEAAEAALREAIVLEWRSGKQMRKTHTEARSELDKIRADKA